MQGRQHDSWQLEVKSDSVKIYTAEMNVVSCFMFLPDYLDVIRCSVYVHCYIIHSDMFIVFYLSIHHSHSLLTSEQLFGKIF